MTPTPVASGTEFQVNTYTALHQSQSNTTALADGGYLVTWGSLRQGDDSGRDIYAQRYDSDGNTVGDEFRVNTPNEVAPWQGSPKATALDDGGYVITWDSFNNQDGSGSGVYAQIYDNLGAAVGEEFLVNSETQWHQSSPEIATLANGNFVISWTSSFQDGDGNGLYAQLYSPAGAVIGGEMRVNTDAAGNQNKVNISTFDDGGYVIVWAAQGRDDPENRFDAGVFGQRFDDSGNPVGAEFQVNTTLIGDQNKAAVSSFANGNFVVTWSSSPEVQAGIEGELMGRLYAADGTPLGGEFQGNTSVDGKQSTSSITELADGGFVVIWATESYFVDGQGRVSFGISGQRFDATGAPVGDEFMVNTDTIGPKSKPSVDALADGSFVVSWDSLGQDGDNFGVFAQRFDVPAANQDITGTAGDDVLVGTSGADTILGLGGDDRLFGRNGDDIMDGGAGDDRLKGNAGDDTLNGGEGSDVLFGDEGVDVLNGDAGIDFLYGGAGNDVLNGNDGDDRLNGGADNDALNGGAGDDRLKGKDGDDVLNGGEGSDVLFGDEGDDVLIGGTGDDFLYGGRDHDELDGGAGNDRLRGNLGEDTLNGDAGNDNLYGGGGNDMLNGGAGNDFLFGENGTDVLDGGAGNDRLYGGADGAVDTFVFAAGYGDDRVRQFEDGMDQIDLSAYGFADAADALSYASQTGWGAVKFDLSGAPGGQAGDVLYVENMTLGTTFTEADFLV